MYIVFSLPKGIQNIRSLEIQHNWKSKFFGKKKSCKCAILSMMINFSYWLVVFNFYKSMLGPLNREISRKLLLGSLKCDETNRDKPKFPMCHKGRNPVLNNEGQKNMGKMCTISYVWNCFSHIVGMKSWERWRGKTLLCHYFHPKISKNVATFLLVKWTFILKLDFQCLIQV